MTENYDVIIIGTGAGGGTLAHALRSRGSRYCCWNAATSCPGRAPGHRPDEGIAGTGGVPFVGDSRAESAVA